MRGRLKLETRIVSRIAVTGGGYHGVRFEPLCEAGDRVRAGEALLRDARRPEILVCAPRAGRVLGIDRGARRRLQALRIEVDDALGAVEHAVPAPRDRSSLRRFLLDSGAWSSLRTRPFGRIPDPDAEPAAIFVSAADAEPLAPEPKPIIDAMIDEFRSAIETLSMIVDAPLFVCHAPGHELDLGGSDRVRRVAFGGGYSAGLPGVHIHALCPIGFGGGEVWHLGYQDAIALGHLVLQGSPWLERIVSIGGSAIKQPRSLRVAPGASIGELLAGELLEVPHRILAGSPIYGRPLNESVQYLQPGQRQVTASALGDNEIPADPGRVAPLIPGESLERLAPPGILAVPLMRALQLGDAERARELGALELAEEDLAPLSSACVSGNDYGALLRRVLDQLESGRC